MFFFLYGVFPTARLCMKVDTRNKVVVLVWPLIKEKVQKNNTNARHGSLINEDIVIDPRKCYHVPGTW